MRAPSPMDHPCNRWRGHLPTNALQWHMQHNNAVPNTRTARNPPPCRFRDLTHHVEVLSGLRASVVARSAAHYLVQGKAWKPPFTAQPSSLQGGPGGSSSSQGTEVGSSEGAGGSTSEGPGGSGSSPGAQGGSSGISNGNGPSEASAPGEALPVGVAHGSCSLHNLTDYSACSARSPARLCGQQGRSHLQLALHAGPLTRQTAHTL